MAEQSAAERTEQPTPRRLSKAREKGQVPHSQELDSVATLIVFVIALLIFAPNLMRWLTMQMGQGLNCQTAVFADGQTFMNFFNSKIIDMILAICPILAILMAGGILANIAVSGLNYSPGALAFKWDAISPASGMQNLVSAKSFVHLFISIIKLLFVGIIVWTYLQDKLEVFATLRWVWTTEIVGAIAKIIMGLMIRICIALLVIGIADTLYQKWKYIDGLKMTRQEVKQEHKDLDGSPEVKSRIRRIQIQMAMKRMLQEVPKASVVLVNPTHVAVALRYETKTMESPVVVAKGADHLAEKIREIARAYGVPIIRRPELARALYSTVEPGNPIPENLYVAVAQVLALIYRLRHKKQLKS